MTSTTVFGGQKSCRSTSRAPGKYSQQNQSADSCGHILRETNRPPGAKNLQDRAQHARLVFGMMKGELAAHEIKAPDRKRQHRAICPQPGEFRRLEASLAQPGLRQDFARIRFAGPS